MEMECLQTLQELERVETLAERRLQENTTTGFILLNRYRCQISLLREDPQHMVLAATLSSVGKAEICRDRLDLTTLSLCIPGQDGARLSDLSRASSPCRATHPAKGGGDFDMRQHGKCMSFSLPRVYPSSPSYLCAPNPCSLCGLCMASSAYGSHLSPSPAAGHYVSAPLRRGAGGSRRTCVS